MIGCCWEPDQLQFCFMPKYFPKSYRFKNNFLAFHSHFAPSAAATIVAYQCQWCLRCSYHCPTGYAFASLLLHYRGPSTTHKKMSRQSLKISTAAISRGLVQCHQLIWIQSFHSWPALIEITGIVEEGNLKPAQVRDGLTTIAYMLLLTTAASPWQTHSAQIRHKITQPCQLSSLGQH